MESRDEVCDTMEADADCRRLLCQVNAMGFDIISNNYPYVISADNIINLFIVKYPMKISGLQKLKHDINAHM